MDEMEQYAWHVVDVLEAAGHEAYPVGGCVRDKLLGRPVVDFDITTSALPEQVQQLFEHTVATGIRHGTVSVHICGHSYEVTTFRTDGEYEDGRRPSEVVFVRSLVEDLARRDFTINAMALGRGGTVHDPFGGREDLQNKIIRAVGDPVKRFQEDALRMLRGIRFAAQLGFAIEADTLTAITYESHALRQISRERIRDEWHKMLLASPAVAFPLLVQTDSLRHILSRPRLSDPWDVAAEWAERAPRDVVLRTCLVYFAVGMEEPRVEKTLQDLKLSTARKRDIRTLWQLGKKQSPPTAWNDVMWRHLLFEHGYETILRRCLLHAVILEPQSLAFWQEEVERRRELQPIWNLQDLAVTGQDLIQAGVVPGPALGKALHQLAQRVLQHPEENTPYKLLMYLHSITS